MTRIFIEDEELDITKDFSQQITYAVDDLTNTDSKSTSFSKTIVLPGTANNNRLLGNIFEFHNSNFTINSAANVGYNFNASKSAKARLEINGLQVMKGILRLLEIIRDGEYIEYEVALFGELGGFYSAMGSKKLTDIDFSQYNHTYNITNIVNSWDNASGGTGYYYPLIDYGNVSPSSNPDFAKKNFYFTAFRPALFVRDYIQKIIANCGYTFTSDFMNTNFFKRLIIPNNQLRLAYKSSIIFSGSPTGSYNDPAFTPIVPFDIEITNTSQSLFTTTDNKTWTYTGTETFLGVIEFGISGRWAANFDSGTGPFSHIKNFKIFKNGSLYAQETTANTTQNLTTYIGGNQINRRDAERGFNFSFSYRFTASSNRTYVPIVLEQNDTFKIVLSSAPNNTGTSRMSVRIDNGYITMLGAPIYVPANLNRTIIMTDTIPSNIYQKDFMSSILKMFNLMVTEDKDKEKHLIIEPYVDFYNTDRTTYLDWSDKVDRSKPIKIKPMSEINARFYQFSYKQDNDFLNDEYRKKYSEVYGQRVFDNNLEFAKETDKTEVIFSASPLIGYSGNDKIFPAIYKKNNSAEEMTEHNIRIMQAKKITGRTSWRIKNSDNSNLGVSGLTSYGYAGHLDDPFNPTSDLNFGAVQEIKFNGSLPNANLFNAYYSPYFAEITDKDSRLVTCKMRLNEKDIFNLDFGRFIWMDGVLYRLVKIVDYTEDDVCEVQLLRAINTTY